MDHRRKVRSPTAAKSEKFGISFVLLGRSVCGRDMDCATPQADALRAFRLGDGVLFGGQTTPNKVSASATVLLGRVDTNGGGFGRELSLRARGSGMERTIPAEMPPDEYLMEVHITATQGDAPYIFPVMVQ